MKLKVLIFGCIIAFGSCSGGEQEASAQDDQTQAQVPEQKAVVYTDYEGPVTAEAVTGLAEEVYNEATKRIDTQKAIHYVQACEKYAVANPDDPNSPQWLLKAAETARNINQYDKALGLYDMVSERFASYEKAPQALFLKAFTLDDNMGKKEEAKVLYEAFLDKYPNDPFAESAKFMLENLYKSDEEIIQEFEKKRKGSEQ